LFAELTTRFLSPFLRSNQLSTGQRVSRFAGMTQRWLPRYAAL